MILLAQIPHVIASNLRISFSLLNECCFALLVGGLSLLLLSSFRLRHSTFLVFVVSGT